MRIGITGANGFVGQALCSNLTKINHQPVAITRQNFTMSGVINRVVADFINSDLLSEALTGCHVLVILASQTHSGGKMNDRNLSLYRKNNVETAVATINAAIRNKVKRVIYLSSIKVNGEETFEQPFNADDIPHPRDPYGITKYQTELVLTEIAEKNGLELCVIRPPLIYGHGVKGNLALLKRAIDKGIPLPFASTNNRRDLISLNNLCEVITICLDHPQAAGQTFLVSDGQAISTADIIRILGETSSRNPVLLPCPEVVLKIAGKLIGKSEEIRRLTGNLEIDINHTCEKLNWHPGTQHTLQISAR